MTDEVRPVEPVQRRENRRAADRRAEQRRAGSTSRELVPVEFPVESAEPQARPAPKPAADAGATAFAAQVMGQTGQRRGLKGGPPVLGAARSAYLGAEHSGAAERRPPPGKAKNTDV